MLRMILVDDEPVILEKLKSMLEEQKQMEVVGTYTDPLQVLQVLPEVHPDCAFLDIEMPGLSGIELAERLLSYNPELEIVFVTAYNHYATQAFEVNAIDYLLKPIRPERLDKAIEKLLKKSGDKQEGQEGRCTIRCFGAFEVTVDGHMVKWNRSRSKELLAYLLQNEKKWLSKYRLCEELWPESEPKQALAYLQICMHTLRKNLREAGCEQLEIEYSDDRYILRVKDVVWDLRNFKKAYEAFQRTGTPETAEHALQVCDGEYLEGEDWLWSDLPREEYICKCDKLNNVVKKYSE